jgi:hypothetical protein
VECPDHGVVVVHVPWAKPKSRFTRWFEDQTAWLAADADSSAVAEFTRSTWRAVTGIVARVTAEMAGKTDRLAGLRRIGIDEVAYRKGQRYLLRVVDHDTGRQVWAGVGANKDTLNAFFDLGGAGRAADPRVRGRGRVDPRRRARPRPTGGYMPRSVSSRSPTAWASPSPASLRSKTTCPPRRCSAATSSPRRHARLIADFGNEQLKVA